LTDEDFHQLDLTDKVWYGKGTNRRVYLIDEIVDIGGLRQITVAGICITNPLVVDLAVLPPGTVE
jgi:hypothetical protein